MGFLDSKSKSSTTSQNAGFSEIGGNAFNLNLTTGKKSVVQVTDGGAVDAALRFAGDALEKSLRQVEVSNTGATKALSENARSETENVLLQGGKWLVIAVIAVAGFFAIGKLKG
jgi:hypothetical protein